MTALSVSTEPPAVLDLPGTLGHEVGPQLAAHETQPALGDQLDHAACVEPELGAVVEQDRCHRLVVRLDAIPGPQRGGDAEVVALAILGKTRDSADHGVQGRRRGDRHLGWDLGRRHVLRHLLDLLRRVLGVPQLPAGQEAQRDADQPGRQPLRKRRPRSRQRLQDAVRRRLRIAGQGLEGFSQIALGGHGVCSAPTPKLIRRLRRARLRRWLTAASVTPSTSAMRA